MTDRLEAILRGDPTIAGLLEGLARLDLPDGWLGGGCVTQTVWNALGGRPSGYGIADHDVVYFDASEVADDEQRRHAVVKAGLGALGATVDVCNEARVHEWYERVYGKPLAPYTSCADAIATWPTTATSIGVRLGAGGGLELVAPFGLDDLMGRVVRPNRRLIAEAVYAAKTRRWVACWPELTIVPW